MLWMEASLALASCSAVVDLLHLEIEEFHLVDTPTSKSVTHPLQNLKVVTEHV